jgi:uncharacterized repeat protein (TIGR01451 family)
MALGSEESVYSRRFETVRPLVSQTSNRSKASLRNVAALLTLLLYPALAGAAPSGADLSIAFTRTAGAPTRGREQVIYSLLVANAGPAPATSISVATTLPQGATFSSAGGIGWSCSDPVAQIVTCALTSLAAGVKAALIGVAITAPSQGGTFRATAKVGAAETDPVPANNSASESVVVAPATNSTP